jgi:hypothetical protein
MKRLSIAKFRAGLLGLLLGAAPAAPAAAQDVTVEPLDPAAVATPPVVTIEAVPPDAPVIDLVSGAEPAPAASTPAAAASNTVHSVQATPIAAAPIEHGVRTRAGDSAPAGSFGTASIRTSARF